MLLKKMEIKEREKTEAVTSRAKAKTKRVASTRIGAGDTVSASGVALRARVCSTRNFTTFRKFAYKAEDYHSCPGHPKAQ